MPQHLTQPIDSLTISGGHPNSPTDGPLLLVNGKSGTSTLAIGQTRPTVTGAKGGNAALTSLMAALVSLGLVNDTTS